MNNLSSPVYPIVTPFMENGDIDFQALEKYINFLLDHDSQILITTVGTSRFNLLENDEIVDLNESFVATVNGDSYTICAGPLNGSSKINNKVLRETIKSGGNAYLAIYPERYYEDLSIIKFYFDLAETSSIPILIHQMGIRSGYGGTKGYSKSLIKKLLSHENISGMKEESQDKSLSNWIHNNYSDKKLIIGQGGMLNFIDDYKFGAKSYLVGLGSFLPQISNKFHKHVTNNEVEKANELKKLYEDEYFKLAVSLGWHVQLKEILSYMGLMKRYERAPLEPLLLEKSDLLFKFLNSHEKFSIDLANYIS